MKDEGIKDEETRRETRTHYRAHLRCLHTRCRRTKLLLLSELSSVNRSRGRHRPNKHHSVHYGHKSAGGFIAWVGGGPDDLSGVDVHGPPSTGGCGPIQRLQCEGKPGPIYYVHVDSNSIRACTPHSPS